MVVTRQPNAIDTLTDSQKLLVISSFLGICVHNIRSETMFTQC